MALIRWSGIEEGKTDRGQGLALLSVNLTSSLTYHSMASPTQKSYYSGSYARCLIRSNTAIWLVQCNVASAVCKSQLNSKEKTNLCTIHFLLAARFVTGDKSQDRISLQSAHSQQEWFQQMEAFTGTTYKF